MMPTMFQDLRQQLLQYKDSNGARRQELLDAAIKEINGLPTSVNNKSDATHVYKTMAYTATLINYAEALHRIENQEFFDILVDFKMPAIFENAAFAELTNYFEFHPTPPVPQMRLKKPIDEIPTHIWQLFRAAQKAQLEAKGTAHKFNLDELDILNPPKDQLYPLPMQMMGKLENRAVDRTCINSRGEYRFAKRNGFYLLPGGGMIEIDLENTLDIKLHKMLDEYLEEERANLWSTAAAHYNTLERESFLTALRHSITSHTKLDDINSTLRGQLTDALTTSKTNAEILADLIQLLDAVTLSDDEKQRVVQAAAIANIRAAFQVETFKATDLYNQAFDHIKNNTIVKQIEQFGDTRACGGKQISDSGLMTGQPLEDWFKEKLNGAEGELGDDLTGGTIERLTLLHALSKFNTIKFSHLLIILANQLECYQRKTLDFNSPEDWNKQQYDEARIALMTGASTVAELEKITTQIAIQRCLDREEQAYQTARLALIKLATAKTVNDKMKQHLSKLLAEVNNLKTSGEGKTAELTNVLTQTQALLGGSLTPTAYEQTAKTMQGKPSQGMRVIGSIMLAICAIAIGIGLAGIAVPITTAIAATYTLTSAVCFFASRQHGLSKAMSQLARDKRDENRLENHSIAVPAA